MIITRTHIDEMDAPYCARGARRWAASVGLDWADFVKNGIDAEKLIATGDPMALKLVEHVRRRHDGH